MRMNVSRVLLVGVCALLSFGSLQASAANQAEKDWTFLVFINGKNNLDPFGAMNINQMESVGSTDKLNVLVQWGSIKRQSVQRLYVQKDKDQSKVTSPVVQDLGEVDMGDWHSVVDFVRWGVENYPAKHYFINVWDHGSGWHAIQARQKSGQGSDGLHLMDISHDDRTGHSITTRELGMVMQESARIIGHKVDIYGSDACLMGMVEIATEMKDSVNFYLGSEELEPGAGWPYDRILRRWTAKSYVSPREVAQFLPYEFVASYEGENEVTLSSFDLRQTETLHAALTQFGRKLASVDPAGRGSVVKAVSSSQSFFYDDYRDLGDLVNRVEKSKVKGLENSDYEEVRKAIKEYVVANAVTAAYSGSQGVSIWAPVAKGDYQKYSSRYHELEFDKATGWSAAFQQLLGH